MRGAVLDLKTEEQDMERRELLSLGGIAAIAGAFAAATTSGQAADGPSALGKRVIRIYADAEGNSHVEELVIATRPGKTTRSVPMTAAAGIVYSEYISSTVEDWHRAPARQFSISMSGEIEVEVSDGTKHAIHTGDMVFLEDLKGKGHITRLLSPVTNIFIRMPDSFDVVAWARGDA
jgi:hypothetical protein